MLDTSPAGEAPRSWYQLSRTTKIGGFVALALIISVFAFATSPFARSDVLPQPLMANSPPQLNVVNGATEDMREQVTVPVDSPTPPTDAADTMMMMMMMMMMNEPPSTLTPAPKRLELDLGTYDIHVSPTRQVWKPSVRLDRYSLAPSVAVSAWRWDVYDRANNKSLLLKPDLYIQSAGLVVLGDSPDVDEAAILIHTPPMRIGSRDELPKGYAIRLEASWSLAAVVRLANYRAEPLSIAMSLSIWYTNLTLATTDATDATAVPHEDVRFVILDRIGARNLTGEQLFPSQELLTHSFDRSFARAPFELVAIQWHCNSGVLASSLDALTLESTTELAGIQAAVHRRHMFDANVRRYKVGDEISPEAREQSINSTTSSTTEQPVASATSIGLHELARIYPAQQSPGPDHVLAMLEHLHHPFQINQTRLILSATSNSDALISDPSFLFDLSAFLYCCYNDQTQLSQPSSYPMSWNMISNEIIDRVN